MDELSREAIGRFVFDLKSLHSFFLIIFYMETQNKRPSFELAENNFRKRSKIQPQLARKNARLEKNEFRSALSDSLGEREENCVLRRKMQRFTCEMNFTASKMLNFQLQAKKSCGFDLNVKTQQEPSIQLNDMKQQQSKQFQSNELLSTARNSRNSSSTQECICPLEDSKDLESSEEDEENGFKIDSAEQIEYLLVELQKMMSSFEPVFCLKRGSFIPYRKKKFRQDYELLDRLGQGAFGTVYKCIHKKSKAVRTVKIIKNLEVVANREMVRRKIGILRMLDHPHVIKMFQVFQWEQKLYIVLQYCEGGNLRSYLTHNEGVLSHEVKKQIVRQMLEGVSYIHKMGVLHRDIKPQNVLLLHQLNEHSGIDDVQIKIIDFGLSIPFRQKYFKDWKSVGSPMYMAPEVFMGIYSTKCDVWSCGIVMHMLLLGFNPFFQENACSIMKKIQTYSLQSSSSWPYLQREEKQILLALLNKNHNARQQLASILEMDYFKSDRKTLATDQKRKISERLFAFKRSGCNLIDIIHYSLAFSQLPSKLMHEFQQMFCCIDLNNDGVISSQELHCCFPEIEEGRLNSIFREIDLDGSGFIDFGEFVCAMVSQKELFSLQNIKSIFSLMDYGNIGLIGRSQLKGFLSRFGVWGGEENENLFKQISGGVDGAITEQELSWFILSRVYFSIE